MPLGEALWENPDLQLCIPVKFRRAPPLPPPPGPAMCTLVLDMLASDPDARPQADQLESRLCSALREDSHWWQLAEVSHLRRQNQSWPLWTEVAAIAVGLLPRGHRNIKIRLWRIFYVRDMEQAQIFDSEESCIYHSDDPTGAETRGTQCFLFRPVNCFIKESV